MIPGVIRARAFCVAVAVMVAAAGCASTGRPTAPSGTVTATSTVAAGPADIGVDRGYQERSFAEKRGITLVEAKRRLGWQIVAPDLAVRLEQRPFFAGVWIDVGGGDRVKIGVVGQVNSVATAEINRGAIAVGLTEGYDVVPARFPLSALNEANDWLGSQLAQVNAGAAATFVAGLRIDLNAVELRTPTEGTLTPKQESLLVAAKVRLGDRLVVSTYSGHFVGLSCGYPRCDPPLRGGTGIYYANGSSTQACTGGFIAKGRADQKLYLITAGHCVTDHHSVDWTSYFTNGSSHVVGPVSNYEFSANGDYAILQITDTTGWNPKPWVALWYDAHGHEWAFNIASDNYSMQGMWVCHSGAETGTSTCGEVTELGVTASYDGATVKNLGEASYCSAFGDSGASVFLGHVAYGIEVGGSAGKCDSIYQGIRAVEAAVNVDVLRTSASDWPEESGTSPTPSASLQIKPA